MALDVERVVNGGVNGQEALGWSGRFEPLHLTLAPSCRLMRILGPIVLARPLLMARRQSYFGHRHDPASPHSDDRAAARSNRRS